ncbi:hypothetical protein FB451DRAFT_87248 [Mycena latifolia]|nr:hypothetical protein FB451DRAFT_87248 [Mycena latifolia]
MFPLRTSKPEFDEKNPLSSRRYFEDVDELCRINKSTPEEMIQRALYYTPDPATEDLWIGILTEGMKWDEFKKAIMRLYPRADGGCSFSDLIQLTTEASGKRLTTEKAVGQYHRQFLKNSQSPHLRRKDECKRGQLPVQEGLSRQDVAQIDTYSAMGVRPAQVTRGSLSISGLHKCEEVYETVLWIIGTEKPGSLHGY